MSNKVITILLVEDDDDDYIMIRDLLSEVEGMNIELQRITSYNEALETIDRKEHDVYLFDYRLGERTGLDLLKEATAHGCSAPMMLLTGQGNKEVDIKAMKSGAADYLVKGQINTDLLERSIRYAIERKSSEEALRKSQNKLLKKHEELNGLFKTVETTKKTWEKIMDCVGDTIILIDHDGKIMRINKAVTELTHKTYNETLGKKWEALIHEIGLEATGFFDHSTELFQPSSNKWFELSSYPLYDHDSEHVGTVITIHETTSMKKMSAELEKKNIEVESAYEELKTTQSQMLQSEKMASIGQLAAGVAHEINNPMGFISSNIRSLEKYVKKLSEFINAQTEAVESFQSPEKSEELRNLKKKLKLDFILDDIGQLVEESLDGADRVKTIVQNLKTFSRVDQAEHKPADINECIESTLNIAWNELKYKVTVHKAYGDIPLTKCYPQQLNQVFMNLLINGAQAIEKEGEITIKTWNGDEYVNISISDSGNGISEDKLNKIFDPFFTTKPVGKGTGLGLSIAYDIVKKHHGHISVESKVGRGTTFTIKIPVIERK